MTQRTVTAAYERDSRGAWLVHLDEEPRCHTWARSFTAARAAIAEAAELWCDELDVADVDQLQIRDRVSGVPGADAAAELGRRRAALCAELDDVRAAAERAAADLREQGLSVRDVAGLMGLTAGRISQIAPRSGGRAQAAV